MMVSDIQAWGHGHVLVVGVPATEAEIKTADLRTL
jgi:hypothetical protein